MSAGFAKIVMASDHSQVLFYKGQDAQGRPLLNQVTEISGVTGRLDLGFDEGEWDKLDAAFDRADVKQADALRALFRQALGEPQ